MEFVLFVLKAIVLKKLLLFFCRCAIIFWNFMKKEDEK